MGREGLVTYIRYFLQEQITERKQGDDSLETGGVRVFGFANPNQAPWFGAGVLPRRQEGIRAGRAFAEVLAPRGSVYRSMPIHRQRQAKLPKGTG